MTSNPQSDKGHAGTEPAVEGGQQQQFTPEELRKAARVQIILYVVMAVFIILPFFFMWLRKTDSQPVEPNVPQISAEQE